jgi:hypothetical protein
VSFGKNLKISSKLYLAGLAASILLLIAFAASNREMHALAADF